MTTERTKRLLGLLATLGAAAILATGCGSDKKKDTTTGGGATPGVSQTDSTNAPKTKSEAVQRCKDEANKLNGQSKQTALAACNAIETGDTSGVKAQAKKQCLDATKQITNANARKKAEQACNKFN
jgi:hypothetical protein